MSTEELLRQIEAIEESINSSYVAEYTAKIDQLNAEMQRKQAETKLTLLKERVHLVSVSTEPDDKPDLSEELPEDRAWLKAKRRPLIEAMEYVNWPKSESQWRRFIRDEYADENPAISKQGRDWFIDSRWAYDLKWKLIADETDEAESVNNGKTGKAK